MKHVGELTPMTQIDAMEILDHSPIIYWQVELNPHDAFEFALRSKNSFLIDFIREVNCIMPVLDYGKDNTCTGKLAHTFSIGKEHTRVVYVNLILTACMSPKVDTYDLDKKLREIATKCGANEIDQPPYTGLTFKMRVWWD